MIAILLVLFLWFPYYTQAQTGVVVALEGRAAKNQVAALRIHDGLVRNDVVDIFEKSMARLLLGGKATVTLREHSRFIVNEEKGRAVIELKSGALLINVARKLMEPGEEIQVRTNMAVAAIRGSLLFVEAKDSATSLIQLYGESSLSCAAPATSCPTSLLSANFGAEISATRSTLYSVSAQQIGAIRAAFGMRRSVVAENRDAVARTALDRAAAEELVILDSQGASGLQNMPPSIPDQPKITPRIIGRPAIINNHQCVPGGNSENWHK